MDEHFVLPKESGSKSNIKERKGFVTLVKKLTPIFILSALLPMFLFFVSSPTQLAFFTSAAEDPEISLWVEPSNVVGTVGGQISLDVYAQTTSDKLISNVSLGLSADGVSFVSPTKVERDIPFNGQVLIGSVVVVPQSAGTYSVNIDEESIVVQGIEDNFEIKTAPTTLYVR